MFRRTLSSFIMIAVVSQFGCVLMMGDRNEAVSFTSDPRGARVFVDDELIGKTPAMKKLTHDDYVVRITKDDCVDYHASLNSSVTGFSFAQFLGGILLWGPLEVFSLFSPASWQEFDTTYIDADFECETQHIVEIPPNHVVKQRSGRMGQMVAVPAGEFVSGCNHQADLDCYIDEQPGRMRRLESFQIDTTEVTLAAFRECVQAGYCEAPEIGGSCNEGRTDRNAHPVNCVDWGQAKTYCEWRGKRLPTEWEWEKAARGTNGQTYPWGDAPLDCQLAVTERGYESNCKQPESTSSVGSKPAGVSPYGATDMAGNVWEWTSSEYPGDSLRVVRGGSWFDVARHARTSMRGRHIANSRLSNVGFRCAQGQPVWQADDSSLGFDPIARRQQPMDAPERDKETAHGANELISVPHGTGATSILNRASFGRYYALVIGNNVYQDMTELRTAVGDARAVSAVLHDRYGFTVELIEDATRAEILEKLSTYRATLEVKDNLVIYYAGHGLWDHEEDHGYWLPVDATRNDPTNWIANAAITRMIKAMKAKHVLVIADSCYSGTLTRGLRVPDRRPGYITALVNRRARAAMTSGGLEPVSDGGAGNHSVFASALLSSLSMNEEVLEAHQLFAAIRRRVALGGGQVPQYAPIVRANHEDGEFIFVPSH
jgi:formylglycine-generating enzyme required for sulfatase activity